MHYLGALGGIIVIYISMIYYIIHRFFTIFSISVSQIITWIIAGIIGVFLSVSFFVSTEGLSFDVLGTIAGWIFVLAFIMVILLGIENIISHRYRINPRIIIGLFFIIFGFGTYFALVTKITNLSIKSDKVSQNTKILFVTDIHVDNVMSKIHLNELAKTIKKENPEFVIIGGDLMNKPNDDYVKYFSILDDVEIPIYAVIGNHDIMGNSSAINLLAQNSKIRFLFNDAVEINGIQLIGIIDKSVWGTSNLSENIDQTNFNQNNKLFNILISHQPIAIEKLSDYQIDLELAGHTHRGQFVGMRGLVYLLNDYGYGKYNENGKYVFVSQGIGTRGLPFRLGTQSEIVIINLES